MPEPNIKDAQWADIGVNLGDKRFRDDTAAVLDRARDAGLVLMLLTGTDVIESRRALALCREHPNRGLLATAGVHPHNARRFDQGARAELAALLEQPQVAAAGEMGLDFNRDFSPRADQERAFESQLALAAEKGLPVFLHQRDAHPRFLPILKAWRDRLPAAVVHCFTDNRRALYDYLDLDCHIGITGWVCDERRGQPLAELVPEIPAERLLIETDAPYLLPRDLPKAPPVRQRNEPAFLPWIGRRLAALRGEDETALAARTLANARRFLNREAGAV